MARIVRFCAVAGYVIGAAAECAAAVSRALHAPELRPNLKI